MGWRPMLYTAKAGALNDPMKARDLSLAPSYAAGLDSVLLSWWQQRYAEKNTISDQGHQIKNKNMILACDLKREVGEF